MDTSRTTATLDHHRHGRPTVVGEVWFGAGVWSADVHIGTISGLVCSARSPHLHDVVIRDAERPHDEPLQIPVVVPRLRPGDVLVHPHVAVYVGGHHVGLLSGVQADTTTAKINAVIVDVGHHWHHRQVLVPASDVEDLSDLVVSLRGTREGIRHMPASAGDDLDADLTAVEPRGPDVGQRDPDTAHVEAAHRVADVTVGWSR